MCLNSMTTALLVISGSNQGSPHIYYYPYGPKQPACKETRRNLCIEESPDTDLGTTQESFHK